MKKINLVLIAITACLLFSCENNSTSPGKIARNFYKDISEGNCVKAMNDSFDLNKEDDSIDIATAEIQSFCDKLTPSFEEKGGIKDVIIVNEKVSEDKKTAEVDLKIIYGSGGEEEINVPMVLNDKGKWKITIGLL